MHIVLVTDFFETFTNVQNTMICKMTHFHNSFSKWRCHCHYKKKNDVFHHSLILEEILQVQKGICYLYIVYICFYFRSRTFKIPILALLTNQCKLKISYLRIEVHDRNLSDINESKTTLLLFLFKKSTKSQKNNFFFLLIEFNTVCIDFTWHYHFFYLLKYAY